MILSMISCQSNDTIIKCQFDKLGISFENNIEIVSFEEGPTGLTDWVWNAEFVLTEKDFNKLSKFICKHNSLIKENNIPDCNLADTLFYENYIPEKNSYCHINITTYKKTSKVVYRFYDEG